MRLKLKNKLNKMNYFDYIIYGLLIIFAFVTFYPLWYVIINSFNDGVDFLSGGTWLFTRKFTLANYKVVFLDNRLWTGFKNTVLRTVIGTSVSILYTSIVAYAFGRPNLRFKKFFQIFNLFTMFFSGGLIPFFLLINIIGLYDSFLVYIFPTMYSVYNMIIISSFFRGISNEMHESARIDGANEFIIWWSIYMPLSTPILITVGMWNALSHWNAYMATMLYTQSESLITLQYFLMRLIKDASIPEGLDGALYEQITTTTLSFAAIIVSIIPITIFYPSILKMYIKGNFDGAIKG
jgi:putative aldouronate transport system permease protein